MKKILVLLGIVAMTSMLSSCFCPGMWDDPYYGHGGRTVVVEGHHGHGPVHAAPRHSRGRW